MITIAKLEELKERTEGKDRVTVKADVLRTVIDLAIEARQDDDKEIIRKIEEFCKQLGEIASDMGKAAEMARKDNDL